MKWLALSVLFVVCVVALARWAYHARKAKREQRRREAREERSRRQAEFFDLYRRHLEARIDREIDRWVEETARDFVDNAVAKYNEQEQQ